MIRRREAPVTAVAPKPIPRDGLFALDVDDDIWQDVGLDEDQHMEVPRWLSDDKVREGIRVLLEHDRCTEEEHRVLMERVALQMWFREEWLCLNHALLANGSSFHFLLFSQYQLIMSTTSSV